MTLNPISIVEIVFSIQQYNCFELFYSRNLSLLQMFSFSCMKVFTIDFCALYFLFFVMLLLCLFGSQKFNILIIVS